MALLREALINRDEQLHKSKGRRLKGKPKDPGAFIAQMRLQFLRWCLKTRNSR